MHKTFAERLFGSVAELPIPTNVPCAADVVFAVLAMGHTCPIILLGFYF